VKTSLPAPTVAEARRIDDFRLVGCIACWMLGHPETPYDVQHFLSGTHRISHGATCPLCPAHHRGVDFSPSLHIVSFATRPRAFRQVFGDDDELIALTDRIIAIEKVKRGIYRDPLSEADVSNG
jgi:hypothetical protein